MNVYKQYLKVESLQRIALPIIKIKEDIIKLGVSDGKPCLWFLAKKCCDKIVVIHSYMTGEKIPDDIELNYLGSYSLDSHILVHVFTEN